MVRNAPALSTALATVVILLLGGGAVEPANGQSNGHSAWDPCAPPKEPQKIPPDFPIPIMPGGVVTEIEVREQERGGSTPFLDRDMTVAIRFRPHPTIFSRARDFYREWYANLPSELWPKDGPSLDSDIKYRVLESQKESEGTVSDVVDVQVYRDSCPDPSGEYVINNAASARLGYSRHVLLR